MKASVNYLLRVKGQHKETEPRVDETKLHL